jgi:mono/diheme cytochrome c family protein
VFEVDYHKGMNKSKGSVFTVLSFALLVITQIVMAQTKVIKDVDVRPTLAYKGVDLFREYCAVCHGSDGRGAGPAAEALKTQPTDLTQLSKKNQGKFPDARVQDVILGDQIVTAHGTKEMPLWGELLRSISINESVKDTRITNLVLYVQSIQR